MQRYRLLWLFAVSFFLLGIADASASDKSDKKRVRQQNDSSIVRVPADLRYELLFVEAKRQELLGNYDNAFAIFNYCVENFPQQPAALYGASQYYSLLRNDSLLNVLLRKASELDGSNYTYKEALASFLIAKNKTDDAIAVLETLYEMSPQNTDILAQLAELYSSTSQNEKVVKTIDRLELMEGKSERLSMQKFRIFSQMNDYKRAFAEMESLAKEYPNDLRYRVLLADLLAENGKKKKADKIYAEVEQIDPDNVNLLLSKVTYYYKTGQDSLRNMQLDKIIANPNVDWNLRVNIMKSVIYQAVVSNNDSVRMSNLFRKALALPQQNIDMAELCVRYMVSVDSPVDSVKPILRQILRIDPENSNARNQLLSYAINEQDTASIVDICQTAVDFSSDNLIYYYYLTIARFQQGDKEKALEAATKGLKYTQNEKNINLIVGIFSLAADLNHAVGNDDVAFQLYDSCLLYNPDDDLALNNYAYYLSLKKMNLNKAEDMSRKAIDRNPDNSTYLDTYAWVLFVKRRYREAREYIDKAIERMEKSGEEKDLDANIYDHAGDIYFKNNSFDKAFSLWEKASQLDPSMEKTKMKLKLKRYVE